VIRRLCYRYFALGCWVTILLSALAIDQATISQAMSAVGPDPVEAQSLNLLVIHTDEHNFRTLGCYRDLMTGRQALMWGDAVVETPHIDWIAQHGVICTSFYATTPVCSPSRSAFVSGRYPQHTPVTTNDVPMADDVVTFGELLRRKGYATGYAGKWHLDGGGKPQWAPERKFGFEDNRYMFNRGHWKQLEITADGPRVKARKNDTPDYSVVGADEKSFTTDFLADRTVEFIQAHRDKPFCFMVSIPDPHGPDTVRAPYDTMFKQQQYEVPPSFDVSNLTVPNWGRGDNGRFLPMASYYGMVKCIDDNVGKILTAVRSAGLLERTVIVFTSDHGDLRGEHHRQNKGVPFEASAKVPFLVYAPGKIPAGTVVNEALSCVDFLPTMMTLLGYEVPSTAEGRNAAQLLTTGKAPSTWQDVVFIRSTSGGAKWLAVVSDRYKLVYSDVDNPWLFDLQEDPDEQKNCFVEAKYREVVRQLTRRLEDYRKQIGDPYAEDPKVRSDMAWALSTSGDYTPRVPPRILVRPKNAGKAKANAKNNAKAKTRAKQNRAKTKRKQSA